MEDSFVEGIIIGFFITLLSACIIFGVLLYTHEINIGQIGDCTIISIYTD